MINFYLASSSKLLKDVLISLLVKKPFQKYLNLRKTIKTHIILMALLFNCVLSTNKHWNVSWLSHYSGRENCLFRLVNNTIRVLLEPIWRSVLQSLLGRCYRVLKVSLPTFHLSHASNSYVNHYTFVFGSNIILSRHSLCMQDELSHPLAPIHPHLLIPRFIYQRHILISTPVPRIKNCVTTRCSNTNLTRTIDKSQVASYYVHLSNWC